MKKFISRFAAVALLTIGSTLNASAEMNIQEVTSETGITAWLVEEHTIPFTALEISFRGGTSLDRAGMRGETNLMMATLEEGAGELDARAFAQARDSLAAHFNFSARADTVSISARFLSENKSEAVDLLRSALLEPRFDEDAVERVRGQVNSVIQSEQNDPNDIASSRWFSDAFGAHAYGTSDNGTYESIAGLTPADLDEARLRAFAKDRLYVAAVGDITAQELAVILDDLFASLPETGPELPDYIEPAVTGAVTVEPFDSPQSVVYFGHQGLSRLDEDFIPAYIANEVFGGSRESRLMQEVREKRGLTYGIGSYLAPFDHAELVLGQFAAGNGVVAQAIEVVKEEWENFSESGLTAQELQDAQTYLTGAYALRFDGNAPIANILVGMQMVGLERDYVQDRNDLVNAVTLEEINRVIRELYQPDNLTFVVVGQPEGLKSE